MVEKFRSIWKTGKQFGVIVLMLVFMFISISCITMNSEKVEQGNVFTPVYDHYDSSKSIEEQSILINFATNVSITTLDGKSFIPPSILAIAGKNLEERQFAVLPSGEHTFGFFYRTSNGSEETTARGSQTVTLLPGHFYFLSSRIDGRSIYFQINDIENFSEVEIPNADLFSTIRSQPKAFPVESIIAGIKTKMSSTLPASR